MNFQFHKTVKIVCIISCACCLTYLRSGYFNGLLHLFIARLKMGHNLDSSVFEKPLVCSPSQAISRLLWKVKVYYSFHMNPPLVPAMSHMNPVLVLLSHLHLGLASGSFCRVS